MAARWVFDSVLQGYRILPALGLILVSWPTRQTKRTGSGWWHQKRELCDSSDHSTSMAKYQ